MSFIPHVYLNHLTFIVIQALVQLLDLVFSNLAII